MLSREPKGNPQHRGSIINIASLVSFQGGLNVPAYAAAKGGLAQLTKSFSNQWASSGINVNAVSSQRYCSSEIADSNTELRSLLDISTLI